MTDRTGTTSAEYAELRDRAKQVKPDEYLKPHRFWVAVLIHSKDAMTVSDQGDFLWIKANGKTRVEAVYAVYVKKYLIDVELYLGSDLVQGDSRLMDLNKFNDNTIIFTSLLKKPFGTAPTSTSPVTAAAGIEKSMSNPTETAANQSVTPTPIQQNQPSQSVSPSVASTPVTSTPVQQRQPFSSVVQPIESASTPPKPLEPVATPTVHPHNFHHLPISPQRITSPMPQASPVQPTRELPRPSPLQTSHPLPPHPLYGVSSPSTYAPPAQAPSVTPRPAYPNHHGSSGHHYLTAYGSPTAYQDPYSNDPRITNGYESAMHRQRPWLNASSHTENKPTPAAGPNPLFQPSPPTDRSLHSPGIIGYSTAPPGSPSTSTFVNTTRMMYGAPGHNLTIGSTMADVDSNSLRQQSGNSQFPTEFPTDIHGALSEDSRASTTLSDGPSAKPANPYLQKLLSETSPEKLEEGVRKALDILQDVRKLLRECEKNVDAHQWLGNLEGLSKQVTRHRTVIGVVGNTGAGKSSVINALLDEERLVPTNCMRACTAVVTELSWNDDDKSKYRADIEFIKPEDWRKELDALFRDLLDASGNVSKDCSNPDTDAGVAWAKIKSVYPQKTKEMLVEGGSDMLLRNAEVKKVLGTTKHINEDNPNHFYKRLQFFVDSQEKVIGPDGRRKEKIRMEYWPLIKVVKIYTRAEALSTGAVVVDLPGVQDSNAARAAVAAGYMKQCTGLWILAPITRAVDDKAAKSLLGDSFKRQLKLDGTYGNVTFICSKTDDISLEEAVAGLGLGDEVEQSWTELDSMTAQLKDLKDKLNEANESKDVYKEVIDECDDEIEVWENLEEKMEEGKPVFAPNSNSKQSKKRKRDSPAKKPRKKKRRGGDTDDDPIEVEDETTNESDEDSVDEAFEDGDSDSSGQEEQRQPLTDEDVASKLRELKSRKKEARRSRGDIDQKISEIQDELKDLRKKHSKLKAEISYKCITGRNNYSKQAIQQDFAAGIKELDQENAQDEDEENFDPDTDMRDYKEVARSLPVFCVSSRAYQKLCGRMKRDNPVAGFNDVSETEVPQLQAHCKKLTEAGRSAASRRFLHNLSQILTSLSLWASREGRGAPMTTGQHRKEVAFLERKLTELDRGLNEAVDKCLSEMIGTLTANIYHKWNKGIQKAIDDALPIADGWGAHRAAGGLHCMTYKAIVKRDGSFTGSAGPRDFNKELMSPVIKSLASNWEKCFQRQLPVQVASFTGKATKLLRDFHKDVQRRAHGNGVSIVRLNSLNQQLQNYEPFLREQVKAITDQMNDLQREANREFTPVIAAAMRHAYNVCADESGKGSYVRMKSHMHRHVESERRTMFQDACDAVKTRLTEMCDKVKDELGTRAEGVYQSARRDYTTLLGNLGSVDDIEPSEDHELKNKVHEVVEGAEDVFRRLIEGDDEEQATGDDKEEQNNVKGEQNEDEGEQNKDEEEHSERLHQETEADSDTMDTSKMPDVSEAPDTTAGAVNQERVPHLGDLTAHLDDNKENVPETTDKASSLKHVVDEDAAFHSI